MAGCIFIKESVVEQQIALRNRGAMRDKSNFSEPPSTFIGVDQLQEDFLPLRRASLCYAAIFEGYRDVFDQATLMR